MRYDHVRGARRCTSDVSSLNRTGVNDASAEIHPAHLVVVRRCALCAIQIDWARRPVRRAPGAGWRPGVANVEVLGAEGVAIVGAGAAGEGVRAFPRTSHRH